MAKPESGVMGEEMLLASTDYSGDAANRWCRIGFGAPTQICPLLRICALILSFFPLLLSSGEVQYISYPLGSFLSVPRLNYTEGALE